MKIAFLGVLLFSLCGCETITAPVKQWVAFYQPHEYRTPNYGAMTYLEILNAEEKAKYYRRPQTRPRLMFYGILKATEKQAGIKIKFVF